MRTLSTAEERREAVIEAAIAVFGERGYGGAPTTEVAKAAGISQAYVFRLFPRKIDLVLAVIGRSNEQILETFAAAAARAKVVGDDPLKAMGHAYAELLSDRSLLLSQIQGHAAAAGEPEIARAMRECFAALYDLVARESGASEDELRTFFGHGMLMNVMAAIGAQGVDKPWARTLAGFLDTSQA